MLPGKKALFIYNNSYKYSCFKNYAAYPLQRHSAGNTVQGTLHKGLSLTFSKAWEVCHFPLSFQFNMYKHTLWDKKKSKHFLIKMINFTHCNASLQKSMFSILEYLFNQYFLNNCLWHISLVLTDCDNRYSHFEG